MKKTSHIAPLPFEPIEDDIREYAYHLYVQSGRLPGHDLDNWLEAKACLCANIPRHETHTRLHKHLAGKESQPAIVLPSPEVKNLVA